LVVERLGLLALLLGLRRVGFLRVDGRGLGRDDAGDHETTEGKDRATRELGHGFLQKPEKRRLRGPLRGPSSPVTPLVSYGGGRLRNRPVGRSPPASPAFDVRP